LVKQRKAIEAMPHLEKALKLNPASADAHAQLGVALAAEHRSREAVVQYREALRLKPEEIQALNGLAWLLATQPEAELRNGPEAVRLAERACRFTSFKAPALLGTLSAAYAEAGRFEEAVKTAEQASRLATSLGQTDLANRNQKLLATFQVGKPYRDGP
jgi:Flp pilus assembly protein TadD